MKTLAEWMAENGVTNTLMAELCGTDVSRISRIRRGLEFPNWPLAARIKRVTNEQVSADSFLPPVPIPTPVELPKTGDRKAGAA